MSLSIGRRRAGRSRHTRSAPWLVLTLLVALVFSLLGTPSAAAAGPPRPGPEGLPEVPPTPGPQVVGGTAVPDGKYPFQAALLIQSGGTTDAQRQFCGGSLISSSHVLTAAHCVSFFGSGAGRVRLSELRVVVGRTVLTSDQGQRLTAQKITIHPRWQPSTFRNDAAVITLSQPVLGIRPIRLVTPGVDALERPGRAVIATGWGNTIAQPAGDDGGGAFFPDRMQEVTLPVVSPEECAAAFTFDGVQFLDANTMMCAGRTGRDTCQGDSGGPLFLGNVAGGYMLLGITSWGVGCATTGFPGVYTKLSNRDIGNFIRTTAGRQPVRQAA